MARLCERPGCSTPADVSYGFDADTLVVWLDTFQADTGARSGVLCLRHADAMVVPLGWMLDDRRDPVPRLFRTAAGPPARPAPRRVRHERPPVVQLSLEEDDITGELIISPHRLAAALALDVTADIVRPVLVGSTHAPAPPRPRVPAAPTVAEPVSVPEPAVARPEIVERPLVAEEPAAVVEPIVEVATLVEVAAQVEVIEEVEVIADVAVAAEVAIEAEAPTGDADETVVLPWQPHFDQTDDLKGLLKARGRLLSRAFRGQTAESG